MVTQPQLLDIAIIKSDVAHTPEWVVHDMVEYFKPRGVILEPCAGDGVFLRHLPPSTLWCEIKEGRDFFAWHEHVDWCVGNPPYSVFANWLEHSMEIADNILYLLPCNKAFNGYAMMKRVYAWGGIVHMRVYGPGSRLRFQIGYAIGAIHYKRDYNGPMTISFYPAGENG